MTSGGSGSKYRLILIGNTHMYCLEAYTGSSDSLVNYAIDLVTLTDVKANTPSKFQNGSFIVKLGASRYVCIKYSGYGSYSLVSY